MGQTWNGDLAHDAGNVISDIGGWFSGPPGDPGRIRQVANDIEALQGRFDCDRRALDEAVDELMHTWHGDAAGQFQTTWYGGGGGPAPAKVLDDVHSQLGGFVRQLRDYADQLEHAQDEHWIQMGILAALTVVNVVQLGADPATVAAEVGAADATAVGTSFTLASVGTMAFEGGFVGFSSDVVSQLGADILDHLDPQFDQTGDHAVSLFDPGEAALSTLQGGIAFGLAGGAGAVADRFGGELLGRVLENPLMRPVTVGTFAGATDAATQLITTGHVDPGEVLVNGGIGGLVSTVAPAGPWPVETVQPPRPPDQPTAYSVAFEMQLDPQDLGRRRTVHFNRANSALAAAIQADPEFGPRVEQMIPGAGAAVDSAGGRTNPPDWTWHHAPTSVVQGRVGVMQLVPAGEHTPGTPFYKLMHPDGFGGYKEWAIANGAPRNR